MQQLLRQSKIGLVLPSLKISWNRLQRCPVNFTDFFINLCGKWMWDNSFEMKLTFLVVEFDVFFVFSTSTMSFSNWWRIVCQIRVTIVTVILWHFQSFPSIFELKSSQTFLFWHQTFVYDFCRWNANATLQNIITQPITEKLPILLPAQ